MSRRIWIRSILLLIIVTAVGVSLAAWKHSSMAGKTAASAHQPEHMEAVTLAVAKECEYRDTTTSIGTIVALRSITLRNELAGRVQEVNLNPGEIVEAGTVLVALDVSVEEAELQALQAQAALAKTTLERTQRAIESRAASEIELERAQSERNVALAQIARVKAIIERKTLRAPFRAHVGIADVHVGQYLQEGTLLTTLQGVDEAVHVDFTVVQRVAEGLHDGDQVEVFTTNKEKPISAKIVAVDARIDPTTRNAIVRAKIEGILHLPTPGASVRVRVPIGPPQPAVSVPVSALRKGPSGDFVFVIAPDQTEKNRAQMRKVKNGTMIDDQVLIYDGLAAGEKVAASGSFKLHEGALVNIVE